VIHNPEITALDKQYLHWLSFQKSCVSRRFSETDDQGRDRSIACHVRRARDSGTGFKPPFRAVPMTFDEHALQHGKAESALYSKEWFDEKADAYLEAWLETIPPQKAQIVRDYLANKNPPHAHSAGGFKRPGNGERYQGIPTP
jgi:hypothetical protein